MSDIFDIISAEAKKKMWKIHDLDTSTITYLPDTGDQESIKHHLIDGHRYTFTKVETAQEAAQPPEDDIDVKQLAGDKPQESRREWTEHNLHWDEDQKMWRIPGTNYSIYEPGTVAHINHVAMLREFPWLEEDENETDHYLYLEDEKIEWMPLWNHFKQLCGEAFHDNIIDPDIEDEVKNEAINKAWKDEYAKEFAAALAEKFGSELRSANPVKEIEDFVFGLKGFNFFSRRADEIEEYWNTEGKKPTINVQAVADAVALNDLRNAVYPQKDQLQLTLPGEQQPAQYKMFEADEKTGEDELSSFMRQMKLADPAQVKAFMEEHFEFDEDHQMWEIVGFSDYSGGTVERGNARYFQQKYPGLISVGYGGFNTEIYGVKEEDFEKMDAAMLDALYRDLQRLETYPILDDELHSEVEQEKRQEAWDAWIKSDFRKLVTEQFPQFEEQFYDYTKLQQLFELARDRGGAEWNEESGGDQVIRLEDVFNGVSEDLIREVFLPEQDAAQQRLALESRSLLGMFHPTSSANFDEIEKTGLRKPFLVNDPEIATYYAQEAAEESGGHPMVVRVVVRDTTKLRADYASFEEPLTFVYKNLAESEDDWHQKLNDPASGIRWPSGQKDWKTSLDTVGSVRYDGTIPPGDISFDIPESLFESHKFSCLMAPAPTDLADKVIAWGKMFITDEKLYTNPEHLDDYGREDEPHVTVKFGLHRAEPCPELLKIIEETQPFEIALGTCSLFEAEQYDVVKFDVESDALRMLNERVSQLKNSDSHPEYHPHLTVAYAQKGTCNQLVGKPLIEADDPAMFRFLVKMLVFASLTGKKQTLFVGKPNLEESILQPDPQEIQKLAHMALEQIYEAVRRYKAGEVWPRALQQSSSDSIGLSPKIGFDWGGSYRLVSKRVFIEVPTQKVGEKLIPNFTAIPNDLSQQLGRIIAHEVVHQQQDVRIPDERQEQVRAAHEIRMKLYREQNDYKVYFNDPHEVMAYAHDYVQKLLQHGQTKEQILQEIRAGSIIQPLAWGYLTPENKRRYLAYAYQYASQLPGS